MAGPSCAFWPSIGEVDAFVLWPPRRIANFTARVLAAAPGLDIITWHYYPGLSTRSALAKHRTAAAQAAAAVVAAAVAAAAAAAAGVGALPPPYLAALGVLAALASAVATLLWRVVRPVSFQALRDPAFLDTAAEWAARVGEICATAPPPIAAAAAAAAAPPPAVWLGETGSAQVGGEPGVSGRWGSALWWLDQLGLLALSGQRVQCRQTLLGSDYGLIDANSLEGTPDFWASVLWKKLMGPHVLAVSAAGAPRSLRLYCHRPPRALLGGPMSSVLGAPSSARRTYLAINLGRERAEIDLGAPARVWLLEAAGGSDDASTVTVNGKAAATQPDGTVPDFPGVAVDATPLVIPPGAALFALV